MKMKVLNGVVSAVTITVLATHVLAQAETGVEFEADPSLVGIEEIMVVGRMRTAADEVVVERQNNDVVADYLTSETISKIGDSTVAAALRRVPGVTLIDDKFVFIRGLGERYSTSLLNGAQIPSPDLTRNVIPLDIFPTSIISSIAIQKGYSADMPISFSGGLIDIRTNSIPNELIFSLELGSNYNTETSSKVLSYNGGGNDAWGTDDGGRALPQGLSDAINYYQGSLDSLSIYERINLGGSTGTLEDAQQINRELALQLNRDVDIAETSPDSNIGMELNIGNNFYFDNGMEIGFVVASAYSNVTSSQESVSSSFGDQENIFSKKRETVQNYNVTGNLGFGWRWYDDHSIETTSLLLRNSDDKTFITDYYDSSFPYSDGRGFRNYGVRFEERELIVNQIHGSHRLGGVTRDITGFNVFQWMDDLSLEWFFSDSESITAIPGETTLTYQTNVNPASGVLIRKNLQPSPSSGDFRFTDLDDQVENYGWDLKLPLYLKDMDVELSGGYRYAMKGRTYKQIQFGLGTTNSVVANDLNGLISQVFSDENILNPENDIIVDVIGSNGESYLAGITNASSYGKVDVLLNESLKLMAGVHWEDYKQAGIPWNPLDYRGCQTSCDIDELRSSVFAEDDYYYSFAFTYMKPDFIAETFQLRLGYSETVVRPDLREITPSSFIDPITGGRVSGNANVVPSAVNNYDLRGEWYFSNGDNFTASLFYKDIDRPIDLFQAAAFEEATATEIINADSADVYGLELEWLKDLAFIGDHFEPFFLAGNLILLETELNAGPDADAPTNMIRPLSGASNALNLQIGFDSPYGVHSAMLVYNLSGERLYFSGRNGTPDAYEQPFHSLDLTYFWYPTDNWVVKLSAKNLLDEEVEIEQSGVTTFSEKSGTAVSLSVRWKY